MDNSFKRNRCSSRRPGGYFDESIAKPESRRDGGCYTESALEISQELTASVRLGSIRVQ